MIEFAAESTAALVKASGPRPLAVDGLNAIKLTNAMGELFETQQNPKSMASNDMKDMDRKVTVVTCAELPPTYQDEQTARKSRSCWTWSKRVVSSSRTRIILWCINIGLVLGVIICFLLLLDIEKKVTRPVVGSGYRSIAQQWTSPSQTKTLLSETKGDLSANIQPIACHSHNDYWRNAPLFDALAAGCMGVEADIWADTLVSNSSELLVGHRSQSLTQERTLRSLYSHPLLKILSRQNEGSSAGSPWAGVYDVDVNATLVLLLDFKQNGADLWPLVQEHLTPFRKRGYLRRWNGTAIVPGPITIVGSGDAPFDLIAANPYGDIFYDAPLEVLETDLSYNITNSYYASVGFSEDIGKLWNGKLSRKQKSRIASQVEVARSRGLLARYWDTPAWPISLRTMVWVDLFKLNVGMLNIDDLVAASSWDWGFCTVFGTLLCGR